MTAIVAHRLNSPSWRQPLLAVVVICLLMGWLYADTLLTVWQLWNGSETYAHAILVPPISAWLIWRRRHELLALSPRPWPWALLPMAVVALVWLLSDLMVVNSAGHFALVAMFILVVPAVMGLQVARVILFPLLFLFLAVPAGEFMLDPMMNWTADFTVAALRLSGIPVYREGNQFIIPSGHWSVIEACAGVRYLIASFMVGTLFAHLNYRSWQRRVLFMLVSIVVPIVANWVRAYMIVMIGHLSGNTLAVGVDHLIYGWVFFGVVVFLMFIIGARWAEPSDVPGEGEAAAALTRHSAGNNARIAASAPLGVAALASLLMVSAPHLALGALQHAEGGHAAVQLDLPAQPSDHWRASAAPASTSEPVFKPQFERPAAEQYKTYTGAVGQVGVYLAYYRDQSAESKMVTSVNKLVKADDRNWNLIEAGSTTLQLAESQVKLRTTHYLGQSRGHGRRAELTVWRTYWVDGRWVSGEVQAKLATAATRLLGRGDDGATLVFWTESSSPAAAKAVLQRFAHDNLPGLGQALAETQARR